MGPWGCNSKNITVGTLWEKETIPHSHPTSHLIWKKRLKSSNRIISYFLGGQNDKASFETATKSPSHYLTGVAGNPTTEYDHPYTLEVQTPSFITSFIINRKMAATTSRVYTITNQGLLKWGFVCKKSTDFRTWRLGPIAARHAQHSLTRENTLELMVSWKIVDGRIRRSTVEVGSLIISFTKVF